MNGSRNLACEHIRTARRRGGRNRRGNSVSTSRRSEPAPIPMRFATWHHGRATKLLREGDRCLNAAGRHHQDVAPVEQYFSWSPSSRLQGTRRVAVRSLLRVVANTPGSVSPAMLAGIQNPCPVGERDINALLPKRRAELDRKLIQHGLDGRIGEMAEVRVDRFARE